MNLYPFLLTLVTSSSRIPGLLGIVWVNFISVLVPALAGCASTYDPAMYYDANAIEKVGRVVSKSVERFERRVAGDDIGGVPPFLFTPPSLPVPYYVTAALVSTMRTKQSEIPIFAYLIQADSEKTVVYSEYPGFEPGNCVKLFLSSRPDYPRIAPWSGC